MLHKTRGIVLSYIKYRETSVIVKVYTDKFGLQSYLINGVRSQKSKKGLALVQPLTLLDLVVYHQENKANGLQRISEFKPAIHFVSIPFDIRKTTIALFITELLSMVLHEEEHHGTFFNFLHGFIIHLDQESKSYSHYHLFLLVQLTHYIGFGIHNKTELERQGIIIHSHRDSDKLYETILQLNQLDLSAPVTYPNALKREVLQYMIQYYAMHIEGFKPLKSVEVLQQIFK